MGQSDEEVDLEDEEPGKKIKRKKAKRQKKGLIARDQVTAAVAAMLDDASPLANRAGTTETPT